MGKEKEVEVIYYIVDFFDSLEKEKSYSFERRDWDS